MDDAPELKRRINEYITVNLIGPNISFDEIYNKFPPGWKSNIEVLQHMSNLTNSTVAFASIFRGFLMIKFANPDETLQTAMNFMAKGAMLNARHKCMIVPGARGMRRRGIKGLPCVSDTIFLKYVNQLTDDGDL